MPLRHFIDDSQPLCGVPGSRRLAVSAEDWRDCLQAAAAGGGRLLALWADRENGASVQAAVLAESTVLVVKLELPDADTRYPGIADLFPAADRMQRAAADLAGVHARDSDPRPWLRHAAWPPGYLPLADPAAPAAAAGVVDDYPFVPVAGDGVHEIAVGPVHAGTIEPGHFRFSVVGEKVLRLEERLGFVHKGIEQRFMQLRADAGQRLAARVSGDSAVAFSWAYCQAFEGIAGIDVPARAAWLRALALECERIANHLGDLGALGNDAGFAFGLAQLSRLKELWLRATAATLGQRYLFDFVVPGGVASDADEAGLAQLAARAAETASISKQVRAIYDEHTGVRDRFTGAGIVTPALAARFGLTGLAGRASGQRYDLRVDLPVKPYDELDVRMHASDDGDVAARVAVRFEELEESLAIVRRIVERLPAGPHCLAAGLPAAAGMGIGLVEGWRGPVFIALTIGADGRILRCHPHDPSWQNWPIVEHAIIGNIVPDFPLINKSFNLSYSGHDL